MDEPFLFDRTQCKKQKTKQNKKTIKKQLRKKYKYQCQNYVYNIYGLVCFGFMAYQPL